MLRKWFTFPSIFTTQFSPRGGTYLGKNGCLVCAGSVFSPSKVSLRVAKNKKFKVVFLRIRQFRIFSQSSFYLLGNFFFISTEKIVKSLSKGMKFFENRRKFRPGCAALQWPPYKLINKPRCHDRENPKNAKQLYIFAQSPSSHYPISLVLLIACSNGNV